MSSSVESSDATRRGRRTEGGEAVNDPTPPKLRRRPALIALSVLLIAVGALLAAWLVAQLTAGQSVVAIRQDIARGDQIQSSDLTEARMNADDQISALPWSQREKIIGKYAAIDFRQGNVVSSNSVNDTPVTTGDRNLVGLALTPGHLPMTPLRVGDAVYAVPLDAGDSKGTRAPVKVEVAAVAVPTTGKAGGAAAANAATMVDVLVEDGGEAAMIARYGAKNAVSLTLAPSEENADS